MPDSLPTVSIMFLTMDRPLLIERALSAALEDPATTEAIVVIDGNDAETRDVLTRMAREDPRVRLTDMPPMGRDRLDNMQRGRDHGASLASSDVVLAMDDDVVAHPGLVSGHARLHAEVDDRVVVVGYMPVVTPPHWPRSYAPIRFYAESYEAHCEEYVSDPGSMLQKLWGGNLSLRRSHWLEAIEQGRARCYHEDKEFGLLLWRQGFRAEFDRSLRGDHWYERTLRGFVQRAQKSVLAHVELRAAYPELVEPGEPWERRRTRDILLALTGPSAGWFVVRWGLITATTLAGALRLRKLEDFGARALWRVAWERAAAGV
jgi:hypothetical protein